jgi:caffeoyl-CoA O-methyltransferase
MVTMKDRADAILRPEQAEYLELLLPPSEPLLAEMERVASERQVPISDPEVGRLLELLAHSCRARRVLEIGTAIGYGTLCLARGASDATVVSLDRDPQLQAEARRWLERGGVADRVELHCGEALELLPTLAGPFELAYIDADKLSHRRLLDLVLPKLTVGGLVVVDNLLWKGRVAGDDTDDETEAIRAFNGYLMIHPQLRSVVLPLGDGVGLAAKTRPLVTEMGGPF